MNETEDWLDWENEQLLPQVNLPSKWAMRIGGLREIGMQSLGYLSIPNGILIGLTWYRGADWIQTIFPTAVHWLAFYLSGGVAMFVFHYVVVYRAWQKFINHQSDQEDLSPGYRVTVEVREKQDEIEEQIRQLRSEMSCQTVVPKCGLCGSEGVPDEHKGERIIACPECTDGEPRILYR